MANGQQVHAAFVGRKDDQEFFGETAKLLKILMRVNRSVKPIFAGDRAVDLVRMPWEGEGAAILGELAQHIAVTARAARKRWNPNAKRWEAVV